MAGCFWPGVSGGWKCCQVSLTTVCPALSWIYRGSCYLPALETLKTRVSANVHTLDEAAPHLCNVF